VSTTTTEPEKPLGHKAYGSIPHLPGSRRGPADRGVNDGQYRICCEKLRDKFDHVIVQEKLDGSCVSVAKIGPNCVPLIRAGYAAISSHWYQHRLFADWVYQNYDRFDALLQVGERVCGEWLVQAHGTRYDLPHEPFVAFDIMDFQHRAPWDEVAERVEAQGFITPSVIERPFKGIIPGFPISIEQVEEILTKFGSPKHGAIDPVEGAVWRVERKGKVDFLAKYVRPGKVDGCYLIDFSGPVPKQQPAPTWNTWPGHENMWPERFK
jgi:hypothetical protein